MPAAWRERALNARSLPPNHPLRVQEEAALAEGVNGFFGLLDTLKKDCEGMASHLRTKYAAGWRALLPMRWRPTLPAPTASGGAPDA